MIEREADPLEPRASASTVCAECSRLAACSWIDEPLPDRLELLARAEQVLHPASHLLLEQGNEAARVGVSLAG